MSKSINLPLYDDFLKIFIDNEIINWQAKHFWEKMELNQRYRAERCKQLMYIGLRVLIKCQYLEVDVNKSTQKAFSYNETSRLNELRNQYKKHKLENIFSIKEIEFINLIKDKENNLTFIESLLSNDKTLEKYLINHKEKLENEIKNMHSNIRLMKDIMN
ncbi:hypothetical protein [Acinetobacter sp. ANC 4973]|uniref:hypothetical protein n=1 Tax=Acinetobacter sp. ANC 4973 TaxID=1977871 RepID=UPI000A3362F6|nr:hypothetical protein [Acinetobacter sp. ANC 4973]OTG94067.1 hypothetical protein B9T30_15925 [Acinetobacter sp. ANC 4973]